MKENDPKKLFGPAGKIAGQSEQQTKTILRLASNLDIISEISSL